MNAQTATFDKQVNLFYLYRIISRFYLYLPILVVYLIQSELSYFMIGLILASYGIAVMIFKPFVSVVIDKLSTKGALVLGEWFKCLGIFGLAVSSSSMSMFILSQVLVGLGFSLTAGTDSSLLLHWSEQYEKQDQYRSIEAKSQSYIFIAILISGIVGALLAEINMQLPFYATVPFNFIASLIVMRMDGNVRGKQEKKTIKSEDRSAFPWSNLHVILFYAVNRATIMTFFILILPLALFVKTHISIGFFGLILSLYSLTAFLSGRYMTMFSKKFGDTVLWVIVPVTLMVSCAASIFSWLWVYLLIPIMLGFASGLVRPLAYGAFNKLNKDVQKRAMTVAEFLFAFFNAAFLVMIAAMFTWDINRALLILIGAIAILSLYQFVQYMYQKTSSNLESSHTSLPGE